MNTSQPASARFAQSYVFTANDVFVFIFSVGGHLGAVGPGDQGEPAEYPEHRQIGESQ